MAITDPNERARRAVIRSIADLTELVTIVIDDPDDPDPIAFQVEPGNILNLTFSRVGIDNDALIRGFIEGLTGQLPEIEARIHELLQDLQPDMQIGKVEDVIRLELAISLPSPRSRGAATKKAAKKAAKKVRG